MPLSPIPTASRARGQLEQALAEGYEVFVVSTRSELGPTDEWWLRLVKPDQIFLTAEETYLTEEEFLGMANVDICQYMDRRRNNRLFQPWQRLFERLEIPFPEGEHSFWLDLVHDLQRFGLKSGSRFKGYERQRR